MLSVAWWNARLYPQPEAFDTVRMFFQTLERELRPDQTVLDIGAGAGELNRYRYRGRVRRMVGVDLDPRITENPLLDEGFVANAYTLPFDDETIDLAFAVYVLEHIDDARRLVFEVHRVLKPGGSFFCLTPNRYHYVPVIASLTPHSFHRWFNRKRGRQDDDTFPTHYRMNDRGSLRRQFSQAGFDRCEMQLVEGRPNYLTFSVPTFLAGVAYERAVNGWSFFQDLRVNIIGHFRKSPQAVSQSGRRAA